MKVIVVGATGFVGRRLVARLAADGHEVHAVARRGMADAPDGVHVVAASAGDGPALAGALAGADVAYYLVHSMSAGPSFRSRDDALATDFGAACAANGVGRVVYLGGLGDDPTSDHLASRQEVGAALGAAGTPVVELRAAVILGAGSASFEMLRYLTERLPFMVCPRWVRTRIQPIAAADVIDALVAAADAEPGVHEIGGPEVTTYRSLIDAYGRARGLRPRLIVDVPLLTPHLSSYWVDLVTPVDQAVSHALIESLTTEVVVRTPAGPPIGSGATSIEDAIATAMAEQDAEVVRTLFEREHGLLDGVYVHRVVATVADADRAGRALERIGGSARWYGDAWAWRLRQLGGRVLGERWRLQRPAGGALAVGTDVDWWTVARVEPGMLVLRGRGWFPGDAWLGFEIVDDRLVAVGAFRPKGVPGFLYWKLLEPIHHVAFRRMARHRAAA